MRRFEQLSTRTEHRRAHRAVAALFRAAGARRKTVRLHEGAMRGLYLPAHEIWLAAHALPNRYRNAFGPGEPSGLVWPSVQLNLPLGPGTSTPRARFLVDRDGRHWVAHSCTLGGRQQGISRDGFIGFLGADRLSSVAIGERIERVLLLGTFERPEGLLDAIAGFVHAAHAYRSALAAGLS